RAWPEAAWISQGDPRPAGLLVENAPAAGIGGGPTLVDESFIDFTDAPSSAHRGCVVLRSLTKFYALPGLRIVAVVGPVSLVYQWKRLREPWQVNVLAEAAALAAVSDKEHAVRTRNFVASEKRWLYRQLSGIAGVHPLPSHANYIFCTLDYAAH